MTSPLAGCQMMPHQTVRYGYGWGAVGFRFAVLNTGMLLCGGGAGAATINHRSAQSRLVCFEDGTTAAAVADVCAARAAQSSCRSASQNTATFLQSGIAQIAMLACSGGCQAINKSIFNCVY